MKGAEPLLADAPLEQRVVNRKLARLVVITFLFWMGAASTWAAIPELFLVRACDDHGLPADQCNSDDGGGRYDDAQQAGSDTMTWYSLATGLVTLCSCPFVIVLGDSLSRQLAILLPCVGGSLQALCLCLLPQGTLLLVLASLTCTLGGQFASANAVFASVADVTKGMDVARRAKLFGLVESALWVGNLVGPTLGGAVASAVGVQRSFVVCASCNVLAAVACCVTDEHIWPQSGRSFNWRAANPVGSLMLLTSKREALGHGATVFLSQTGLSGALVMMPFFCSKAYDLSPLQIGYLQSVYFGSCAVGLAVVLPLLLSRAIRPKTIIATSILWTVAVWSLYALTTASWQLYVLAVASTIGGIYFPPIRASISAAFGPAHYGAALSAIGTIQQLTSVVAPPAFAQLWKATGAVSSSGAGLPYLAVGALCLAGFASALVTPAAPKAAAPPAATDTA